MYKRSYMRVQEKGIDWSKIDWSKIDREKAEFIYNEAVARLDSIHKSNENITSKALGMLSFSLPVLTALTGFFVLQWGNLSPPLLAMSVCSGVFLFAILVLLLLILWPKGLSSAQGEPSAYFTDGYYLESMEYILYGNIRILHRYIKEDHAVQNLRANILRVAVLLFVAFPVISAWVWFVAFVLTNPCPSL